MSKPRLLIADDNPLSLAFFREALVLMGIEPVECIDGEQALQRARADAFDLLLLDARMPVMGGAEVLVHLRAHDGPSRHAIALATTADNDPAARVGLLAAGFSDVLTKPIGAQALRDAIGRFVPIGPAAAGPGDGNPALDDRQSLSAAGGDRTIAAALRGLLAAELEQLPAEMAALGARRDTKALLDRLHRLDASAGFCGAPALSHAGAKLRGSLQSSEWPDAEMARFLDACLRVRRLLVDAGSAALVEGKTP